jgi:hypothetical protein
MKYLRVKSEINFLVEDFKNIFDNIYVYVYNINVKVV